MAESRRRNAKRIGCPDRPQMSGSNSLRSCRGVQQTAFGRRFREGDPEQFDLALEDLETPLAAIHARMRRTICREQDCQARAINRGFLQKTFSRCRRGNRAGKPWSAAAAVCLHSQSLRMSRALGMWFLGTFRGSFTFVQICVRACTDGVVQALLPLGCIQRVATEATVAMCGLQILPIIYRSIGKPRIIAARSSISTLFTLRRTGWSAAFELRPVFDGPDRRP